MNVEVPIPIRDDLRKKKHNKDTAKADIFSSEIIFEVERGKINLWVRLLKKIQS